MQKITGLYVAQNCPDHFAIRITERPLSFQTLALSLGLKREEHETEHCPSSSAEIKNA